MLSMLYFNAKYTLQNRIKDLEHGLLYSLNKEALITYIYKNFSHQHFQQILTQDSWMADTAFPLSSCPPSTPPADFHIK